MAQILQFPIFGGGCIKLVSSDQNSIDWHMCQSQTHLPLLKDKEKILAQITGLEWIIVEWLSSQLSGFCGIFHCFLSQTKLRFVNTSYVISGLLRG